MEEEEEEESRSSSPSAVGEEEVCGKCTAVVCGVHGSFGNNTGKISHALFCKLVFTGGRRALSSAYPHQTETRLDDGLTGI